MAGTPFAVAVGSLPPGVCFTTPQAFADQLAAILQISANPADFTLNYGTVTPSPDKQNLPWFRLNMDGSFDRLYFFWNGSWKSRHYITPGVGMMYVDPATGLAGDPATVPTYDGGDVGPITDTTGSFWIVRPDAVKARFPVYWDGGAAPVADSNAIFHPPGLQGPYSNAPNLPTSVAGGATGATIPGAAGTYNVALWPAFYVETPIYRSARLYYEISA